MFVIRELAPYRTLNGGWAFDDPNVGLEREAFVAGADTLLTQLAQPEQQAVRLLFSAAPFPGARQLWCTREEFGGAVYIDAQTQHVVWLCPALFCYFDEAPLSLWIKVE